MSGGKGWAALVAEALGGARGMMPALVPLGSSLQPFQLPAPPGCPRCRAACTRRGCFSAGPVLLVSRCLQMLSFQRHGQMAASS